MEAKMTTTRDQIKVMLDFMAEHTDLARNKMLKSYEGRMRAKKLWADLTNLLNAVGGAHKSSKQWQKVWSDKKYMAKKASSAANRSANATGGGPSDAPDLSDVDHNVINIMGDGFGLPDTGAITDPFGPVLTPNINIATRSNAAESGESGNSSLQIFDIQRTTQEVYNNNTTSTQVEEEETVTTTDLIVETTDPLPGSGETRQQPAATTSSLSIPQPTTDSNRTRRSRLRLPRTPGQRALPDDVRSRLFRIEEEKKEEMAGIRRQLENLTDVISAALVELRRLNS